MNQNRWKTVNEIFHDALELPPGERKSFVQEASGGDSDIQAEVEVLLQADGAAGSYLESPITDQFLVASYPPPLNPGDVLCQRFRIVRAVGEGGMGHVFEAYDSELAVRIALKVIRPEIASNPAALARFRQEVRLAHRITHPNVCRTYDIQRDARIFDAERGTKREVVFLTMEFLEGETLASRIKQNGPVPSIEALESARQIAGALNAAHDLGIIHRDMKPANIMLVPMKPGNASGFRAVITDFGLARLDPVVTSGNHSGLSHTARPIGTLAYMAPEQLENGPVSPATDIYAFGLVLFEMVTGTRAFPSENLLSGIAQRLAGPPPSPQKLVPGLPQPWCRAIEGCLRLKPEERFQSATDVIAVLDGGKVKLPAARHRPLLSGLPPHRRMVALVAVLLAAVALFAGALRLYRSSGTSKVAPGALVYLTQIKNETGEKAFDNLTELIQAGLTQSVQINLLDPGRVGDVLQEMTKAPDTAVDPPIAREIAMRAGAVRVIFATVTGSAGSYNLNIDIQQPDNTPTRYREHWARSFSWHTSGSTASNTTIPPELLSAVRTSSNWIRLEVGESANDIARLDTPPEDVTTDNWEALAEFMEAERLQEQRQTTKAVDALEGAVKLDPSFSVAYGRLGDLLLSMGRYEDGYRAYAKALDLDENRRLSRKERDRIRGEFALDACDYAAAEQAYRDLIIYYENDYNGWSYRGYPLLMLGRTDEAIESLKHAYSIDPTRGNAPYELARAYISKANYPEALAWASREDSQGSREYASYLRGAVQFLTGNYAAAADSFRAMQTPSDINAHYWSYLLLARLEAETGHSAGAVADLNAGIQFAREQGQPAREAGMLLGRAYMECHAGQAISCRDDLRASIQLEPSPQRFMIASSILGFALLHANGADADMLRHEIDTLERNLPQQNFGVISDLARARVRGEALLAHRHTDEALVEFRKADELDAPINGREYLGRALETAAGQTNNRARALELSRDALKAYAMAALHPNHLWFDSADCLPGYYADQLTAYVRVAKNLGEPNDQVSAVLNDLHGILGAKSLPR